MPDYNTEEPRRRTRAYGVLLAGCVAVASLVLVAITHEPKKAVSSPAPAKAAIVPQIADAKSEAEILFRGKSYVVIKRAIVLPFKGEVMGLTANEGDVVNENDTLASYELSRESMTHIHAVLYPEMVLNLKKGLTDQRIQLDKHRNVDLKIKQIELDRIQKELADVRELFDKRLAAEEAVKNKERHVDTIKKEIEAVQDSIKQTETAIEKTTKDLGFYEDKQRRDIDLLQWQARRSYDDSALPLNHAFLKAPISGQILWIANDLREKAELPAGFQAMTIAPTNPMVVRCKVHELDLVKLKPGDRGTVVFDAIPEKKYPCKVNRIPWVSRNPALEVPADYDIECILDNPDGRIKDGLTCNVKVSIAQ
jgi:multidrug efflux pump subunit AcrA (membrane-fusion protein)